MAAKIMFGLCCVFFVTGTFGLIKGVIISARTRKRQKQFLEANQSNK